MNDSIQFFFLFYLITICSLAVVLEICMIILFEQYLFVGEETRSCNNIRIEKRKLHIKSKLRLKNKK